LNTSEHKECSAPLSTSYNHKKISLLVQKEELWVNPLHLSIEEVQISEVKKIYPNPIRDLKVKVKLSL
jgi:hypothetical protein